MGCLGVAHSRGSGRPPQRASSPGTPVAHARDAHISEARCGAPGGASGLHPTLRRGAKDGAPELLGLVKGRLPARRDFSMYISTHIYKDCYPSNDECEC